MQRNPIDQFMKDPDHVAKVFIIIQIVQISTTAILVIGTILFILYLAGVIHF